MRFPPVVLPLGFDPGQVGAELLELGPERVTLFLDGHAILADPVPLGPDLVPFLPHPGQVRVQALLLGPALLAISLESPLVLTQALQLVPQLVAFAADRRELFLGHAPPADRMGRCLAGPGFREGAVELTEEIRLDARPGIAREPIPGTSVRTARSGRSVRRTPGGTLRPVPQLGQFTAIRSEAEPGTLIAAAE